MSIANGTVLDGRYRILGNIGQGNYGLVYLACDERTNEKVAVKLVPADAPADSDKTKRLMREARALALLRHANIPKIHHLGCLPSGQPYFIMEFVRGESLARLIARDGPLSCDLAVSIAIQAGEALRHAHEHGVLHRDFKPEHVLIQADGCVKVIDFGLSRISESVLPGQGPLTGKDVAVGSPEYMSPEQCHGDSLDERCDIYALGLVLFEMLTASCAFTDSNPVKCMVKQIQEPLPEIVCLNPGGRVPKLLRQILKRACEKERDMRYQDVGEMLADLKRLHLKHCTEKFQIRQPGQNAFSCLMRRFFCFNL